jgi:glycosyltransferase involved in cell wall biosynthesis
MKKVCYVVTIPGTIRSFFIPQLNYLSERGMDVTVICSYDEKLQENLGKEIRYIPIEIPRGISIGGSLSSINALKKVFEQEKFDLVQYSTPNAAFYASIAAKHAGISKRNYHLMGFRYLGAAGVGRILLKQIEKWTCSNSTSIECVSRSNLEIGISNHIFKKDKVTIVWNGSTGGVDLKRFNIERKNEWRTKIRKEYCIEETQVVFGFVGRITKDKGINELIGAFRNILIKESHSVLMLIGNFEGEENLEQEMLEWAKQSKSVIFIPNVLDVERYYATLDVLVLPSYREGFGNVVIEAEAMGVPVIVSNIPGPIDAMQDEVTGLQCRMKSKDDLCNKMERFLQNELREQYGIAARKFVEESFDSKILCDKIYQRKRELLSE